MQLLIYLGKRVFVPKVARKEMTLLEITRNDDISTFIKTKWGIPEPCAEGRESFEQIAQDFSDLLIVLPAVGLTRTGMRIGYGGGFYDRYLTKMAQERNKIHSNRIPTIGIGLACQQIYEDIHFEAHDVPVDTVLLARD